MSLIKQLEKYRDNITKNTEELAKDLVMGGGEVMQTYLNEALYSGDLSSEVVTTVSKGKGAISLEGTDAGMIEFGAGTYYPDNHPLASKMGAVRGEWGKGRGKTPPWTFTASSSGGTGEYWGTARFGVIFETMGTPANRVVYNTGKELERVYVDRAKEVFGND